MANTEWQLNGHIAQRYEEYLVPVIFVPWAQDLLKRAGLGQGQRLLDLACGTGIVARTAAKTGVSVSGSDINEGMLAVAHAFAKGLDVSFEAADAQDLPFPDKTFDAVICQQGLQFFTDKGAAVSETFRVLKPGGQAIFCVARGLKENPLMQAQVDAFAKHIGEDATGAIKAVCSYSNPEKIRRLFQSAGFDPIEVETVILELVAPDGLDFVTGLMKSTPAADRIAALNDAERRDLRDSILEGFADHYSEGALRFPHSANVVVAARPV